MPIDLDKALGAELPERSFSWTASDVLLYHLGIGFGSRPGDNLDTRTLSFTNDTEALQVKRAKQAAEDYITGRFG